MKKIIMTRGLQGSGKTTWALNWVKQCPEDRVRFNRDDIRNMLGTYWVPTRESLIDIIYYNFVISAMSRGYNIVIDNMNLDQKYIDDIISLVKSSNKDSKYQYEVITKDFLNVPLETCITRDSHRANPIGESVIRNTYNKYKDKIAPWKYLDK